MHINFSYNSLSFIVLICFGISLLIQLFYHWGVFSRVAFYKKKGRPKCDDELEPVSVVLCAHNAYEYLIELLPALINLDYPDFEIVVVNDCSDDETSGYLKDLERREPKIKPVQLEQHLNFFNGKKFPLSMGIKSAKNDLLILTECNCMPSNDQWLRSVVNCYKPATEVVLGYCPFSSNEKLFNKVLRFDTFQQGILYLSAALMGQPYMGIGKNLSYRKNLFYRNNGFISHYVKSVGDDDLFINQVAKKKNTEVLIDAENAIVSNPTNSFKFWMRQKSSRCSTIPKYGFRAKLFQDTFTLSHLLFYVSFIALLCMKPAFTLSLGSYLYLPILVVLFLLRFGSQAFIYHKSMKKLGEKGLMGGLVFYDILFAFLSPLFRLMGRMNVGVE